MPSGYCRLPEGALFAVSVEDGVVVEAVGM